MENLILPTVSLIGIIVGAVLHFLFTRLSSKNDFERDKEIMAYLSFLNAVSGITMDLKSGDKQGYKENLKLLTEAKCKISIFGNLNVIEKLTAFEKGGPSLDSLESTERYLDLINSMRNSTINRGEMTVDQFNHILLGGSI